MLKPWICGSLCVALASIAQAADRRQEHPIAGLRLAPETTVIDAPLNHLGYPDYVAALNERLSEGVAPEQNFWAAYDETMPRNQLGDRYFEQLISRPGFERAGSIGWAPYCPEGTDQAKANSELTDSTSRPWKAEELPIIASWLARNRDAMARVAEAARRPKAYDPLITARPDETLAHVLLPHVQQSRDAARAFTARAFLALAEGRDEDAWQDVLTMHRMAKHLQSSQFLIGSLVGLAVSAMARPSAEAVLVSPGGTPEVTARRWKELTSVLMSDTGKPAWLISERFCTLDLALAVRSGRDAPQDLIFSLSTTGQPAPGEESLLQIDLSRARDSFRGMMLKLGDVNETLAYTNRYHDRIAEAFAREEFLERKSALEEAQREFLEGKNPDDFGNVAAAFFLGGSDAVESIAKASVAHHFATAYQNCNEAFGRQTARTRLLHAAFAAQLHFRETGHDLADSAALDTALQQYAAQAGVELPAMKDPHSGGFFRISRQADRMIVYGIGPNGVDNGGRTYGEGEGNDDQIVILKR